MSLHDLFTQAGRDRARRRFRLRLSRRVLGLPGLPRHGVRGTVRVSARGQRRLSALGRALARETPRLASMFAMFNELAGGEPVGAERLPSRTWPRPRLVQVAFLATLAAIVALCVVLSTQVHGVMRPCLAAASPSSSAPSGAPSGPSQKAPLSAVPSLSPPAAPVAGRATGAAFGPVRNLNCQAYATTNK